MPGHYADGGAVRTRAQMTANFPTSQNIEDYRDATPSYPPEWGRQPGYNDQGKLERLRNLILGKKPQDVKVWNGDPNMGMSGHYAGGGNAPPPMRPMSMSGPPGLHLIQSATPGRTDRIRMHAKPGSFIIPADVMSGMGQGNTTAGAKMFGELIAAGPYGAKLKAMGHGRLPAMGGMKPPGMKMPSAPNMRFPAMHAQPRMAAPAPVAGLGNLSAASGQRSSTGRSMKQERFLHSMADGGVLGMGSGASFITDHPFLAWQQDQPQQQQQQQDWTPIVVAGGEGVVDPDVVREMGGGDIDAGKKIWHEAMASLRKQFARHTLSLPEPIK